MSATRVRTPTVIQMEAVGVELQAHHRHHQAQVGA